MAQRQGEVKAAFSLNLYREVFFPVMSTISKVTPTPTDGVPPAKNGNPIEPEMERGAIVTRAKADGAARGWTDPPGAVFYDTQFGIFKVLFFRDGADDGLGGGGPPALFYDGQSGRLLGEKVPWTGTAADIFVTAQFPVHSGRILGLPGRILISLMGLVVATLSVTGVVIWWRKRAARVSRRRREAKRPLLLSVRAGDRGPRAGEDRTRAAPERA